MRGGFGSMPTLTWDDLKAIQNEVPSVRWASPMLRGAVQAISDDQNWSTSVNGINEDYFLIRDWNLAHGERLTRADVEGGRKVVVIGQTVAEKLFGASADPVGQTIRIKSIPFVVLGVLESKGQSAGGQEQDDVILMPYTTFLSKIQRGMGQFIGGAIMMSAVSGDDTERAEKQVSSLLRDRHRLADDADDDFQIRNLKEIATAIESGTRTLTLLLAAIAAVSLLVGGIGIMNIMLVSVTERTREIGLRMAVGAKPSHILSQFLVEALTLSLAGGVIGIALGLFMAQQVASAFDWPFVVRPDIIIIAVGFSAMVGVVFGLYPARKASLLDPIEALRYE